MQNPDFQRIEYILDYCNDIDATLDRFGRNYQTFLNDRDFYNSISMNLLQIGELAKGISNNVIEMTPDIPWSSIKGMRDHFAHGYGEMDAEIIFNTAVNDIPKLKSMLEQLIK